MTEIRYSLFDQFFVDEAINPIVIERVVNDKSESVAICYRLHFSFDGTKCLALSSDKGVRCRHAFRRDIRLYRIATYPNACYIVWLQTLNCAETFNGFHCLAIKEPGNIFATSFDCLHAL